MRLLPAAVLCLSTAALADLTVVNESVTLGKPRTVTLSAKGSKTFFQVKELDGPTRTMVHDGEAKKWFIIDHGKKAVLVITEEVMQAQLARLPSHRERMEKAMLGQQAEGKVPVFTWEKRTTPARKISGFSCQDYTGKRDGALAGEGCFATWKDLGISAEEFKAAMLKPLPTAVDSPLDGAIEVSDSEPGFPVWRTHVDAEGRFGSETTLKSLSRTAVAAENFELPKDYRQELMPPPKPAGEVK